MHEIITLQLGQLSNYTATHFWNTQESYFTYSDQDESPVNHNVHWRPGVALDGSETFLPRTVVYDLKGGFGSLRKINALYDASQEGAPAHLWKGSPQVHKQPQVEPSAFQQSLDLGTTAPKLSPSDVRYWSDFSRSFYHPKSLNQLYDYELNSSIRPFDKWTLGRELFDTLDKEHDIVDRDFRPFVEEADQMQGFQIVTTIDDAWGGFATEYVERLRDEYGKVTIWVWGLQTPVPAARIDQRRLQMANTARTIKDLCEHASMLVPMALPQTRLCSNINMDLQSPWHATALLGTAMETAGFPSRLNSGSNGSGLQATLSDLVSGLNQRGRQTMSRLQMSIVGPTSELEDNARTLQASEGDEEMENLKLDTDLFDILRAKPLTGRRNKDDGGGTPHLFGQAITTRGTPQGSNDGDQGRQRSRAALVENSTQRYYTDKGFPMLDSFPEIYLDSNGELSTETFGVKTSLSTDTSLSAALKALRTAVSSSIGVEDREDISNELADLAEAYREGWSSGSDDEDD
ncbi:Misato Segment II myosin-like domain-containing protein [Colletotrichum higginsianum IMI 349063]|uniref:Misato Segment II myosin-like domain-containing protein n=2 Tax=Colletotrichum higginsianum TaxID=80884 RepID=A0A1B7YP90_COLHI|nr:Misato Segment II myosin-like domain-containing protein [Colletotrichum higginsianum IMI 349063]OBR13850.1 Misato Segment II myosin-like domain-containing protein [Colletotrichum higginsianum IMI 349063]TID02810.1 Protein DML1 [Colletotrichum higginsianum]